MLFLSFECNIMQFLIHEESGNEIINLSGDSYNHIFKSRRTKQSQIINLRNLKDLNLYSYEIINMDRKSATLRLKNTTHIPLHNKPIGHIILAIIDIKEIEKILPFLNEINIKKLTLFYADFSQKSFTINNQRFQKILHASSEQCGRITTLEIEILNNLQEVLSLYNNLVVLDFNGEELGLLSSTDSLLVGCEGGFSDKERKMLRDKKIYSIKNANILKAQSATMYGASRFMR